MEEIIVSGTEELAVAGQAPNYCFATQLQEVSASPSSYVRVDGNVTVESTHPLQNANATIRVESRADAGNWVLVQTVGPVTLRGAIGNAVPERQVVHFRAKCPYNGADIGAVTVRVGVQAEGVNVVMRDAQAWIAKVE